MEEHKKRRVTKIETKEPPLGGRVESGALQINDDWTGLYLRGDDSFALAMQIKMLDNEVKLDPIKYGAIKSLVRTILDNVVEFEL